MTLNRLDRIQGVSVKRGLKGRGSNHLYLHSAEAQNWLSEDWLILDSDMKHYAESTVSPLHTWKHPNLELYVAVPSRGLFTTELMRYA